MSCKYSGIYNHGEGLGNENISCHINKQDMSAITDFWPPKVIEGSENCNPEGAAIPQG